MLKSYKELSRWYGALEPETASATPSRHEDADHFERPASSRYADHFERPASSRYAVHFERPASSRYAVTPVPGDEDGPAQFPHYIRDEDADDVRARGEVPADLASTRSEFTGGWSDWVAGRAPGPDDEYAAPRDGEVVRFPWPDDDEYDHEPAERPARPSRALKQAAREHPGARRARVAIVLIAAILLLAVAGAGVLYLLRSGGGRGAVGPAPIGPSMQFTAGSVQSSAAVDCPTERGSGIVRGAEAGSTDSGPDVVLAFQYAYYVERSGQQARALVAPDAVVSPASVIQHGIDTVPVGTTHCVRVQTITENRYSVEVTEYRPGGAPATYNKQTVSTAVVDGRTLITGIAAG